MTFSSSSPSAMPARAPARVCLAGPGDSSRLGPAEEDGPGPRVGSRDKGVEAAMRGDADQLAATGVALLLRVMRPLLLLRRRATGEPPSRITRLPPGDVVLPPGHRTPVAGEEDGEWRWDVGGRDLETGRGIRAEGGR